MADKHADFWREWWERDYSWEGLGEYLPDGTPKHPLEGWIVDGNGVVREHDGQNSRRDYLKNAKAGVWPRLATLQDYWRDQGTNLIPDPTSPKDGKGEHTRHFTRFHLPLHWDNGTPTGKAEWVDADRAALNDLIGEKIESSAETAFKYGSLEGPDRRVQFQGGVFLAFNANDFKNQPAEPDAESEPIQLNWRSDFAFFSGYTRFESAIFSGTAWFESATFSGYAGFQRATFSGDAWFNSATFSRNALFNSATFSRNAGFKSATFSGDALFKSATFSRNAGFKSATFSRNAGFKSATFSGDALFKSATFSGDAWFNSATFFRNALFNSATFSRNAGFKSATFSGYALFNSAIFAGDASFQGDGASFSVEPFQLLPMARSDKEKAKSGDVAFADKFERVIENGSIATRAFKKASFEECVFLGDVNFNNRDFTEATSFRRSEFWRLASFHGSRLHQGVSFYNAIFRHAIHRDRQCVRCGPKLGGRDWPQVSESVKRRLHEADQKAGKTEANYEDWCEEFEAGRTQEAKAFRDLPKSKYDARENDGFWKKFGAQIFNIVRFKKHVPQTVEGVTQEDYFEELEACCRTLKLAMEDKRDRVEEGKFFSLEIKTRRRRRRPNVPYWERLMSDIYGGTSDYGNSVVRPVGWILGSIFLFGLIYLALGNWNFASMMPWNWPWSWPWEWRWSVILPWNWHVENWNWAEFWQAMSYSAGRVLGFGPWSDVPEAGTMMGDLLNTGGTGLGTQTAFGVRFLASLQTLIAIILVFLSGLAVRRRFQIN